MTFFFNITFFDIYILSILHEYHFSQLFNIITIIRVIFFRLNYTHLYYFPNFLSILKCTLIKTKDKNLLVVVKIWNNADRMNKFENQEKAL